MSRSAVLRCAAFLMLALAPVQWVSAHHSFAAFDRTRQVELSGTVKEFQFTNPHSWVQLLVVPEAGGDAAEWTLEALSPNVLGRQGWKRNTLKPGDHVKVLINPLRDGRHGGLLVTLTLENGTTLGGGA